MGTGSNATPGGSFFAYAVVTELNTSGSWELISFPVPELPFADDFELGETARWSRVAR